MEGKEKRGVIVQSVARALTMISCFANDTELGISEIAERMDLSKSTTYGLVNTLTAFGYLEQTENKKYRLGLKLFAGKSCSVPHGCPHGGAALLPAAGGQIPNHGPPGYPF